MRTRILVLMIILLLISSAFSVSGSDGYFFSRTVILTYSGGLSSGQLVIENNASLYFTSVTIRGYYVLNSSGSSVSWFNITVFPKRVTGWGPGEVVRFNYTLKTSSKAKPGEYIIFLRVWAYTKAGSLYVSSIPVKVRVLKSPLLVVSHRFYVLENPSMPIAFYGDHIVFLLVLQNLKSTSLQLNVRLTMGSLSTSKTFEVPSGKKAFNLTFSVPYGIKPGRYEMKATVVSRNRVYIFSHTFEIESPIIHVNSTFPSEIPLERKGKLIISVIAKKNFEASLFFKVYKNGKEIIQTEKKVEIERGLNVYSLTLPSCKIGEYEGTVYLRVGSWTAFKLNFKYRVYTTLRPPRILKASYSQVDGKILLNITILNPNVDSLPVNVTVLFGNITELKTKKLLPPGTSTVKFVIPSHSVRNYSTNIKIYWAGGVLSKNVRLHIENQNSLTTSSISSQNVTETVTSQSGSTNFLEGLTVITVAILLLLLIYYISKASSLSKEKRRKQHIPKRRSPLGRFKRPKPPKFHERDSLPKKK